VVFKQTVKMLFKLLRTVKGGLRRISRQSPSQRVKRCSVDTSKRQGPIYRNQFFFFWGEKKAEPLDRTRYGGSKGTRLDDRKFPGVGHERQNRVKNQIGCNEYLIDRQMEPTKGFLELTSE